MARYRQRVRAQPEKESELCERFADAARIEGFDVYPEVDGWDLVLIWRGEPRGKLVTGDVIGIEAKLRGSPQALAQAHDRARRYRAPDFAAVLIPQSSKSFRYVATCLGLGVFTLRHVAAWRGTRGGERLRVSILASLLAMARNERKRPLWIPPVAMQGSGGAPAPKQLTRWRVSALRLVLLLKQRGFVTSADFKAERIAIATWKARRWLEPLRDGNGEPVRDGKLTRYVAGPVALPDKGYEAERDAIAALVPESGTLA